MAGSGARAPCGTERCSARCDPVVRRGSLEGGGGRRRRRTLLARCGGGRRRHATLRRLIAASTVASADQFVELGCQAGGGDGHGGCVGVEGAVGAAEFDGAAGVQGEGPAVVVDGVVMPRAQRQQVVEIGRAVLFDPFDDVVDLAVGEPHLAVGEPASPVHRPQLATLRGGGDPPLAALIDRHPGTVQHDRDDVGITTDPPDRLDRQREPVGRLAHRPGVMTAPQRLLIDEDGHLGRTTPRRLRRRHQRS